MSDVQKPVEETPAVVPAAETAVEAPAATETTEAPKETTEAAATPAVEEAATDKPAETTEAAEEKKEEIKPATEGILGHKAPGLVKGLRFAKRFFYFNDEPVEAKQLSVFHQNEKPATANPTAAWASQTGKGLFFLTKRAEDKATPASIFNLADVTDLTKEGSNEFLFKVAGQKHTFQASNAAERDSWFVALEAKSTEAKAEKDTITSSEGYKAELEKLTKPVVAIPAAKKTEEKKEETPAKEDKAEETEAKEEKAKETTKSRSQSRKRASIFGSILGKKDAEEKKPEETKEEAKAETTEEATPAEPTAETVAEPAVVAAETPAAETTETPAAEAAAAPAEATEEEKKEEKTEEKKEEKKSKRASIFGNFFQKVASPSQEKSEKEATAPAEETPVASSAPQLDNPVEEAAVKPIEPETVTAAAEGETAKETPVESPAAETASTPKDKRRTSFFGAFGKKEKKADTSDNEATTDGEKEAKKGNKLGGLFRKPSKAVKLDKEEVAATETEAKPEETTEISTEAAKAEETAAPVEEAAKAPETAATEETKNVEVPASTPVQAAA
ncbi:hypothetical protein N7456_004592 [Penicillium angulare]|uniref:PH domain-containing protein n=1 Tax=Penicillium angulare TaxID=116970 RepID=A0A9W9FYJ4_9EURO|nr:hypothetical protein N7456_004592 [Penicillium angulare]